jgi:cellulose synthase/poly-beta-1,6-N-acetylglucosamine synthase-like glycosyltransferase
MMYLLVAFLCIYLLIALVNLVSTAVSGFDRPQHILSDDELPHVAVLVAARNEAHNIATCLQHLAEQDYPEEKISILVGNDQSEDNTGEIVDEFAKRHARITQLHINNRLGKAKGKANVLAQLAHQTDAAYLLITDADITTGNQWARTLVSFFKPGVGIVSGTTVVNGKGFMGSMQQTDWLYFMGLLLSFNRFKIRSTAVGNNMAVRREAYFATGGYEHFDFSVTEDYKLFEQVRKKGWKTINMINPGAINFSAAAADFKTLMNQRKRWLTGARDLPFYWWIIFALFGSYVPLLLVLCFLNPALAGAFWLVRFTIQSATIAVQQNMVGIKRSFVNLVCYEIYTIAITLGTVLFFIIPVKLNWKNRYY